MIIEFELQGSKCLHKGIFDTTGFWVKYEPEIERRPIFSGVGGGCGGLFSGMGGSAGSVNDLPHEDVILGYKIYSHFSFAFYHEDKDIVDRVYESLRRMLFQASFHGEVYYTEVTDVGFFRKIQL